MFRQSRSPPELPSRRASPTPPLVESGDEVAAPASVHDRGPGVEQPDAHRLRVVGYLHGSSASRLVRDHAVSLVVPGPGECESPLLARCVCGCGSLAVWRCSNHRESRCRPCATRYRRRVQRLFEHGLTRLDRATTGYLYGWTITAPGDPGHRRWHVGRRGRHEVCNCGDVRAAGDGVWNASAGARWHVLMTRLRQKYPAVQYVSAAEVQDGKRGGGGRGLLHRHVLLHSLHEFDADLVQLLGIEAGFGCVMDLQRLPLNVGAAARYAAKYCSKSVDQRGTVPWSRLTVDVETGEVSESTKPTFRAWSASAEWGMTMREIKDAHLRSLALSSVTLRAAPSVTGQALPGSHAEVAAGPDPPP